MTADAAQANLIGTGKNRVRARQSVVRIVSLRFAARIDAFQLQPVELVRSFHFHAPNDPDEFLVRCLRVVQTARQVNPILTGDCRNTTCGRFDILNFAGIAVERFGIQAAGQLPTLPVEHRRE